MLSGAETKFPAVVPDDVGPAGEARLSEIAADHGDRMFAWRYISGYARHRQEDIYIWRVTTPCKAPFLCSC